MNTRFLMTLTVMVLGLSMLSCAKGSSNNDTRASVVNYGQSCGAGRLYSAYGCLPACGVSSVMYNNQCVAVTGINNGYGAGYGAGAGYGMGAGYGGYGQQNVCSGQCGAGATMVQGQCLPQGSCSPCYGFYGGYCYMGDMAHQYYGY